MGLARQHAGKAASIGASPNFRRDVRVEPDARQIDDSRLSIP
jgi:hypothetical protein